MCRCWSPPGLIRRIAGADRIDQNGAQGRNRTTDTAIFSRMLYQLSYLGLCPPQRRQVINPTAFRDQAASGDGGGSSSNSSGGPGIT